MFRKVMSVILSIIFILLIPTQQVRAEVIHIPYLENIDTEATRPSSRLGDRVSTNLQFNSTGIKPEVKTGGGSGGGSDGGSRGGSGDGSGGGSGVGSGVGSGEFNVGTNPPSYNIPNPPTVNVGSPPVLDPVAPSYQVRQQTSHADGDTIDKNATELGGLSSSGAKKNSEDFRLNATKQASGLTDTLLNSDVSSQVSRGANYVNDGGDQVFDRAGQAIADIGIKIINFLVMGLFYASIIGAVWCGFRAIIAIFSPKDSAWKWLGGALLSVLIFIIIVSITGIDVQSTAIAEFVNWIIHGS